MVIFKVHGNVVVNVFTFSPGQLETLADPLTVVDLHTPAQTARQGLHGNVVTAH